MKKIVFKISILFIILITIISLNSSKVETKAWHPLDYIHYYEVKIDPRKDGTLDMHFKIKWEVLNSFSEGPLTWIKIGIPNYHVDEIKSISDNIDIIDYYADAGSYIRIDFDRSYLKGEILDIEFSIHQSRMYFLNNTEVYYDYHPGWFDEIEVKEAVILWNKTNVLNHNANIIEDNYLKWTTSLDYGETIKTKVVYNRSSFINLSEDEQFTDSYLTPTTKITILVVIIIIILIIIIISIIARKTSDPYLYERGFYGRSYYYWYRPRRYRRNRYNSSGCKIVNPTPPVRPGGGTGGGSCACACACAGGGRAGCSRKDFYNSNIKTDTIIKSLDD